MKQNIIFQSLDRIEGKEGRSKLLHSESALYKCLHQLKKNIAEQFDVGGDRMDLHIELTKERRDPAFREKAEYLNEQVVDLSEPNNWDYLGRAFVLWTPKTEHYGRTHITIAFFGRHPRPDVAKLREIVLTSLANPSPSD